MFSFSGNRYSVLKETQTKRDVEEKQKHEEKINSTKERNNETAPNTLTVSDADVPMKRTANISDSDGWQTDSGGQEDDESESVATTNSSCSTPTPRSSPKRLPSFLPRNVNKVKRRMIKLLPDSIPKIGEDVVTEVLVVYSTATVVWQDGTIESGIPSTQLYPIHHLDEHEFFPGDFVLSGNHESSDNSALRDYGVIQKVDHQGRTAFVKWFRTYTCDEEPR